MPKGKKEQTETEPQEVTSTPTHHSEEAAPSKSPYRKITEDAPHKDVKLHFMEPPPKPKGVTEEVRLFQSITKGESDKGGNVVTGTIKRWLTKSQAEEAGHKWA